eukprot:441093-Heterocapsa_arctica.AAC.1
MLPATRPAKSQQSNVYLEPKLLRHDGHVPSVPTGANNISHRVKELGWCCDQNGIILDGLKDKRYHSSDG